MTPHDLLAFFGSLTGVARALGCKPQTVHEWVESGKVPEGRQYQAQIATHDQLKADKPALREPDKTPTESREAA